MTRPGDEQSVEGEDIAIVGMSCIVPGADTPAGFWTNILEKVDSIGDAPADLQPDHYVPHMGLPDDRARVGRGGYLGDLSRFDPVRYGVMPNSLEGAEPDQFIALRCAVAAIEDAGVPELPINRERTGVILGRGVFLNRGVLSWVLQGYLLNQVVDVLRKLLPDATEADLSQVGEELKRSIPPFNAETVPGLVHSMMAGRIANRLNLNGPAYTLDAACASTLLAVEHGVAALRTGRCDAVLAGGVQVSTPGLIHLAFAHLGGLSPSGHIGPFSAGADGTLLGQGCGVVVLKRHSDALRDGNRIYALVKAVGISSDGRGAGLLAPRQEGQQLAMERAYEQAKLSTGSVGLIEAHATGIPLGDATELRSLTHCFGPREGDRARVAVGSVKSNIGHLIPASGVASLIKTALALYQRVLPPTLHGEQPNPEAEFSKTPFYLNTKTRPWIHAGESGPRRAAINSFGFGGINAHAILEEHRIGFEAEARAERFDRVWPVELVVLAAEDREALSRRATRLCAWLDDAQGVSLLDVASQCAREAGGSSRAAIVARDLEDLKKKLAQLAKRLQEPGRDKIQDRAGVFWYAKPLAQEGRVAFVFPGEGCQYPNMLADLCRHFPEVRHQFDLTDRAFSLRGTGEPLSHLIFPLPGEEQQAEARLLELGGAVTSVTAASRAHLALLRSLNVVPDALVGHSSGEFGALIAAGAFASRDEDELVRAIAEGADSALAIEDAGVVGKVVLTAIGGVDREAVESAIAAADGRLQVAMDNCPHQLIMAGDEEATDRALELLKGKGGLCERLAWGRPYHTEAFEPACALVDAYFTSLGLRSPQVELWSCATADRYPEDPDSVRDLAVLQWRRPVRFRETVEAMYDAGVRVFVEVGPRGHLSSFVSDTLGDRSHLAVPLDQPRRNGVEQLCRALGMLVASGVSVDLERVFAARSPRPLDFDRPFETPRETPRLALELPELSVGAELAEKIRSRRSPEKQQIPAAAQAPRAASPGEASAPARVVALQSAAAPTRDGTAHRLADFQRTMRQFLEVQRNVMAGLQQAGPSLAAPGPVPPRATMTTPPAPAQTAHVMTPAPTAVPTAPQQPASASLQDQLLEIVSERTGYPPDMLEMEVNLEADLGIDSIKRVEIISAFRRRVLPDLEVPPDDFMERMTAAKTLRQILDGVGAFASEGRVNPARGDEGGRVAPADRGTAEPAEARKLPLIEVLLSIDPGRRLVAECELDVDHHKFLRDHTLFGSGISVSDPGLHGLPVMPMAMTLELLAEAALRLCPARNVAAICDVEVLRWLAFETRSRRVRLEAILDGDQRVRVTVYEADREGMASVFAKGTVELSDVERSLGARQVEDRARASATWADDLYGRTLFHGPSFAGIVELDRCDESGVHGTIQAPEAPLLFAGGEARDLLLPVALLDSAFQVAGLVYGDWKFEDRYVRNVYPSSLERLEFVSAADRRGPLETVVRLDRSGDQMHSDLELIDGSGSVVVRITGRSDRVVEFPSWIYGGYRFPHQVTATRSLDELFSGLPGLEGCRVREFARPEEPILRNRMWLQVLGRLVLSAPERGEFEARRSLPAVTLSWLLGRVAAKDAVRSQGSLDLCLADVRIASDEHGAPTVEFASGSGRGPRVSLAHKEHVAVAVAADRDRFRGVGIDIEPRGELDASLVNDAFSEAEREILQSAARGAGEKVHDWYTAAWCAKEAAGKALSRGVLGGPRSLEIVAVDAPIGCFSMLLRGALAEAVPDITGVDAHRRIHGDFMLALCLIEAATAAVRSAS
jgi:acyl transferase domain-containing protein/phosphopantetheinyl transferase (holo-ACP synthase)